MQIRIAAAFGFLALAALPAFGQMTSASGRMGPDGQFTATMTFGGNGMPQYMPPAFVGAPYSGIELNQRVQTLQDGTTITMDGPATRTYRDSAGRTRTERPFPAPSNIKNTPHLVEINDPVAGQRIVLDPVNRVAHRTALQPPPEKIVQALSAAMQGPNRAGTTIGMLGGMAPGGANIGRPDVTTEPLGQKVIDGVVVEGSRSSTTFPAGAMGNDRPITTTNESWVSPELRVPVFFKMSDPRMGETIRALTNISRAEPDAALFQIPKAYQVIDETGSFTITITMPRQ